MAKTREQFADDLERLYAQVISVVEQALTATKKVSVSRDCKKCGCKHLEWVEVQDVNGAIKAAEFLTAQGAGRPPVAEAESQGLTLVVERSWPGGDQGPEQLPPAA